MSAAFKFFPDYYRKLVFCESISCMSTGDDIPPTIRPTAVITDVRFLFLNLPDAVYLLINPCQVQLSSDSTICPGNIWKKCPGLELVNRRCIRLIAYFRPWKIRRFGRCCKQSATSGRGYRTGCRRSDKGGWPFQYRSGYSRLISN